MATLYVIGAGASRNYAQATHGVDGLVMPLNKDFFKMAKKAIDSDRSGYLVAPMRPDLLDELHALFLPSTYAKIIASNSLEERLGVLEDERLNLEEVMSMLENYDVLSHKALTWGNYLGEAYFGSLKRMLVYTLLTAQKGPACKLHLQLARGMRAGDVVLSFNYDTILDVALRETAMIGDSDYLVDFYRVFQESWIEPENQEHSVAYLKLHGSINWFRCRNCGSNYLYRTCPAVSSFRDVLDYLRLDCLGCHQSSTQPVILPPLVGKDYRQPILSYLWYRAEELVYLRSEQFDRVVAIGYSVPDSDVVSALLLRRLNLIITEGTRRIRLDVVNPSDEVHSRFSSIFPGAQKYLYGSLDEFLNERGS